jgi:hypothetical protein
MKEKKKIKISSQKKHKWLILGSIILFLLALIFVTQPKNGRFQFYPETPSFFCLGACLHPPSDLENQITPNPVTKLTEPTVKPAGLFEAILQLIKQLFELLGMPIESSPTWQITVCTHDVKQCPDGSYVGRNVPTCKFAACPNITVSCTRDVEQCPDGSYVKRIPPTCEFQMCSK